ncbi:hypothetical protein ACRRTK_000317 [Alexandromys fortis]
MSTGSSLPSFLRFHIHPPMGWLDKGQVLPIPGFYMLVPCLQICFWDEGGSCPTRGTSDTRRQPLKRHQNVIRGRRVRQWRISLESGSQPS